MYTCACKIFDAIFFQNKCNGFVGRIQVGLNEINAVFNANNQILLIIIFHCFSSLSCIQPQSGYWLCLYLQFYLEQQKQKTNRKRMKSEDFRNKKGGSRPRRKPLKDISYRRPVHLLKQCEYTGCRSDIE